MFTEENKMIARRQFEEIWNLGKLDLIDAYFAPDFLNFGRPCPPERVRQIVLAWRTAFPDLQFTIEEQIVEADQVLSRCTCSGTHLGSFVHPLVGSLPPTGKRFAVPQMHLTRLRDGRIVEHWAVRDDLAMVRQLGMVFMPAESNKAHEEREQREGMDFTLTEEQFTIRHTCREFAEQEIKPRAEEMDRTGEFPYALIRAMGELGLLGLRFQEHYGGAGADFLSYYMAIEEISRGDVSVGITMEAHTSLGASPFSLFSSEVQRLLIARHLGC